jgi:hypothetical protein
MGRGSNQIGDREARAIINPSPAPVATNNEPGPAMGELAHTVPRLPGTDNRNSPGSPGGHRVAEANRHYKRLDPPTQNNLPAAVAGIEIPHTRTHRAAEGPGHRAPLNPPTQNNIATTVTAVEVPRAHTGDTPPPVYSFLPMEADPPSQAARARLTGASNMVVGRQDAPYAPRSPEHS